MLISNDFKIFPKESKKIKVNEPERSNYQIILLQYENQV